MGGIDMEYYSQIVFKEKGKIASVSPIIKIKAWSKAMAKRRIAKKCDFILEGMENYEIIWGVPKEYHARLIVSDKFGNKKLDNKKNHKAVSFEIAEFYMNLFKKTMAENPLLKLLGLELELIWDE
ncbi:MAG: hypothetical protein II981_01965 [Bacteroidales bacterium]|nr:hypothetical protein [Bacteroidales bacterium]